MKKKLLALILAACLLCLAGCGEHASRYFAVGFVHSNEARLARMDFYAFEGRMVFRLKSDGEGDIQYDANLESGSATVYYEYRGTRSELFSLKDGETIDARGGYVEAGTVYVFVETDGRCTNGSFRFSLE